MWNGSRPPGVPAANEATQQIGLRPTEVLCRCHKQTADTNLPLSFLLLFFFVFTILSFQSRAQGHMAG